MNYTPKDGFPYYRDLAGDADCLKLFSSANNIHFLHTIDEATANYRYADDKWSIKELVGHITDHERIKMFRAFLMSRKVPVELWGYDQNLLVNNSRFEELPYKQILTDLENVRKASVSFIETLSESQMQLKGFARQYEITLEDFLRSVIGHEVHHINILKEKYLGSKV